MSRCVRWLLAMCLGGLLTGPTKVGAEVGAHAFSFTSIEGEPLAMAGYAGRPIMVVNTASKCGYTYQYAALQRLWLTYRDRGLVVLGVPSNDFGGQEPGTATEIKTFCEVNFDVDFPMTEKVPVKGDDAHPLFAWLREQLGPGVGPRWNFHKYLIDQNGHAVAAWSSSVEPDSPEIRSAVEKLLPAS